MKFEGGLDEALPRIVSISLSVDEEGGKHSQVWT
jgi:hypothetical protein